MELSQVPRAPAWLPLLGHVIPVLTRPMAFLESLTALGGVVRIGLGPSRACVVTDPALVHVLLVERAGDFDKGRIFDKTRPFLGNGLLTSAGSFHLRQRRLIQPMFRPDRIACYADGMARHVGAMTAGWRPGARVELVEALEELTLVIVAGALLSTTPSHRVSAEMRQALRTVLRGVPARTFLPDCWERLPTPGNRRFAAAVARLRGSLDELIRSTPPAAEAGETLLSVLLDARAAEAEEAAGEADEQIRDELVSLLAAGYETTAGVLAAALYEIDRHPAVRERLHAELDEVLGGAGTVAPVTSRHLPRLRRTHHVIAETLRLYTPGWLLTRRAVREVVLGGVRIPAGTQVFFSAKAIHRDPAVYPDPHAFDPDRWLERTARDLPPGSCIPFGAGNRQCVGNTFASAEMAVVLASLCSRWRLTYESDAAPEVIHHAISRISRLEMTVRPRGAVRWAV
ncbi:cytochrome P450 [Streptomyces griseocarneus]|uniref:cytochrome P450 n=1 Tax=Streptomyces griseocarneus TaxID=51201 RepID=UPI00167D1E44|nr:cytochrome P450 [Streptomyces griseocarneus]MBZ6473578.1 cytochrome P450 [Streptomyces griseocarneus]GHG56236.1 cytochrome P450 [Streptomyces griseocarneus]